MSTEKLKLHNHCKDIVQQKIDTLKAVLEQLQEAKTGETKSSAGDKFETAWAMMQREEEQYGRQLMNALSQQEQLQQLGRKLPSKNVTAGSLVSTKKGRHYHLSIGLGKIQLEGKTYFSVSTAAPIGKILMGLELDDTFTFNEQEDQIVNIT